MHKNQMLKFSRVNEKSKRVLTGEKEYYIIKTR